MKLMSPLLSLVIAATLSGCAAPDRPAGRQEYEPVQGGPGYGPTSPAGTEAVPGAPAPAPAPGQPSQGGMGMGMGMGMGQGPSGGQQAMCEMHRRLMTARTPEERQALMEQGMPGMSPDMRERHMQMMRERCR